MTKRSIKRILTVVLATSMVLGCTITAFADTTAEGTGTYEGGEMKYPVVSVTLPTIPAGAYNYIADPNGLIAMTTAAAYPDSEFTGTTGVFFLTTPKTEEEGSKNQYTNKSAALTVTNENAQDIKVTVKLEQKTAGDEGIAYAESATFDDDTAKKLYLAVTDDAETDAQTQALSASEAAVLTATVEGTPGNFDPSWTSDDGYGYVKKDDDDLEWNDCSFRLVGALNTAATWGDDLEFPDIKVTWSYAEVEDEPEEPEGPVATPASMSTAQKSATISGLADGATLSSAKVVKKDNTEVALTVNKQYTYSNNVFAIMSGKEALLDATAYAKFVLTYSDSSTVEITIVAP